MVLVTVQLESLQRTTVLKAVNTNPQMSQGHVLDSVAHTALAALVEFLEWASKEGEEFTRKKQGKNSSDKENKDGVRSKQTFASLRTQGTFTSPEGGSSSGESGAEMSEGEETKPGRGVRGQARKLHVNKFGPNLSSFTLCFVSLSDSRTSRSKLETHMYMILKTRSFALCGPNPDHKWQSQKAQKHIECLITVTLILESNDNIVDMLD